MKWFEVVEQMIEQWLTKIWMWMAEGIEADFVQKVLRWQVDVNAGNKLRMVVKAI